MGDALFISFAGPIYSTSMEKPLWQGCTKRLVRGTITCLRMLNGGQSTESRPRPRLTQIRNYHGLDPRTVIAWPRQKAYAGSWFPAAD